MLRNRPLVVELFPPHDRLPNFSLLVPSRVPHIWYKIKAVDPQEILAAHPSEMEARGVVQSKCVGSTTTALGSRGQPSSHRCWGPSDGFGAGRDGSAVLRGAEEQQRSSHGRGLIGRLDAAGESTRVGSPCWPSS